MNVEKILKEISFTAVRSGGPGGQHANKVSSKVVLMFDIPDSESISDAEKERLVQKLTGRLNSREQLILTCDESRSQHKNKEIVTNRFITLLQETLKKQKKRVPTRVSKGEKARRLEAKKKRGLKKSLRQKPKWD
ncbi:alternative ribosome rescue aminoacyl-tRNA hydrolase ArfB [Lutimonas halocynthiae]|uniref:alternative ribosome rescue aminoacyl-tRNA hydrolase ArfB n=1 Tax=Lutimonas halocynthiae TaxID=1446477 RepID=UPI0025B3773A|nr:alternative ribosome rescue aminoacyl-tRNA hydrolase ArfB [Lutimonas halocynthiae]MDN3641285.1 alternative ribosome rescue aminoacyl-tRNA hydrolase ArfB [Lutimonas halocynthiae]